MTTGTRFVTPYVEYQDYNGTPYAGGKLYFYASQTDFPLDTFADAALTVVNPNPITLDERGSPGNVFLTNGYKYKVMMFAANGDEVWRRDSLSYPVSPPGPPPPPPPTCVPFPIDALTVKPSEAFGMRRLLTAYTGPALRVYRIDNGDELDIGFTEPCQYLDTAAMLAFCTGTGCSVVRWYDQSGNGWDLISATPNIGPRIVTLGALEATIGGIPAMRGFHSGPYGLGMQNTNLALPFGQNANCIFAVANATAGSTAPLGIESNGMYILAAGADANSPFTGMAFGQSGSTRAPCMDAWRATDFWFNPILNPPKEFSVTYSFNTDAIFAFRWNTADVTNVSKAYINGGTPGISTDAGITTLGFGVTQHLVMGNHAQGASGFEGCISELLVFPLEPDLADSNILGNNQALFFSLTWTNITV